MYLLISGRGQINPWLCQENSDGLFVQQGAVNPVLTGFQCGNHARLRLRRAELWAPRHGTIAQPSKITTFMSNYRGYPGRVAINPDVRFFVSQSAKHAAQQFHGIVRHTPAQQGPDASSQPECALPANRHLPVKPMRITGVAVFKASRTIVMQYRIPSSREGGTIKLPTGSDEPIEYLAAPRPDIF